MMRVIHIIIWFFYALSCASTQDPVANLKQGRIVGIKVYTESSSTRRTVEIYYGIPYAVPPIGRYRFSAPERHNGWGRTFYAHRMPPHCPHGGDTEVDHSNEDCLFLNIWTPRSVDRKALPVIVILYSESWVRGSISLPCQDLAAEGAVVVTVAYRLHLLSFFTLRSVFARGNLALLDQYLAFLWIRENIAAFGGDPASITVLGHSAGADSLLYHISSPRSAGLFQRAIIMSPRGLWKAIDDQNVVSASDLEKLSREIAFKLGCNTTNDQEILHCMRSRPLANIFATYLHTNWSQEIQPVPDDFLPETEQYLPVSLVVSLSSTKQPVTQIDLLFGTTDLEAINSNEEIYNELLKRGTSYITEYANTKAIPSILKIFSLNAPGSLSMLTEVIRWEYWHDKIKSNDNTFKHLENLARMESSAKWGAGSALLAARLARRVARLYVYRYSQPGGVDLKGQQFNYTGAVHGSDLVSLLGDSLMLQIARRPATVEERRISSQFQQYIINFIKYGAVNVEGWLRYKVGDGHIYDIRDKSVATENTRSASKEVIFWLQYLPELSKLMSLERTEQLTLDRGEGRLRGGVFAMCGVTVGLLILLCACLVILQRQRSRRLAIASDGF
ncbi:hypothetical protein K1T71_001911 [Dendrolimus kikuchii]|uniref:Uncharacterized protein n=1 Tax=Dendrolimus kikuchii TaxID=765133 RepID=A0ACC1DGJ7_9NEOP|nr:hypothetical protein K1T71_001911 [Dendrolimus kikuchii]